MYTPGEIKKKQVKCNGEGSGKQENVESWVGKGVSALFSWHCWMAMRRSINHLQCCGWPFWGALVFASFKYLLFVN